ncbi:hypothetical protein C8J57DRAFT_1083566 [Mycena rebaudengoi]|nr:hypothetical protein C8J57DRAFT_1083566 [Mycena rebaudengoi]
MFSTSHPLVDLQDRIFAVLVGQPCDEAYAQAARRVFDLIRREGNASAFPSSMSKHRRGPFPALNVGLSYGKGQRVPSFLDNGIYASMLARLVGDPDVKRMATSASAAFALWAPRLYSYYRDHDQALRSHLPHLPRNFPKSVFSCAAFNFGPSIWTYRHRDMLNVPFGWCAIQAFGRFDPTKGGHLVLWELKMIIEFPPGATILLPSATISHSNIPVQAGDERVSFTQFTAGGLLRYVDNGFRTEKELVERDLKEYEWMSALKDTRWQMGLGLLSTVDELLERLEPVA